MGNEIEFKFGDYAIIEQKRHGAPNEMYVYKVIGQLRSNKWVDVPVWGVATEILHKELDDVCLCIRCGIDETVVHRYRVKDMQRSNLSPDVDHGHVDKPMAEVGDVVRMILTAKEDLANDPALPEDGLSGEYAEKSLAEWEAELREGADK
ncbi:hypothetical protein PGN98_16880 [Klebsiella aerogenes]